MDDQFLALYLRLSPEFGGTRFGPFEEVETRLGSAQDNDITLPETLGVSGHHVKVLQQSGMGLIVAPVERTAGVYVWQAGARRPRQIATPIAVRPGDSFSLVTPEGPRFIVEIDKLPPQVIEQRLKRQGRWSSGRLSKESLKEEGKRQAWVALLTTGPGQLAARAYQFIRSGTFLQPRYLFLGLTMLAGYIATGFMWFKNGGLEDELDSVSKKAAEFERMAQFNEGDGESIVDYDFQRLAQEITGLGSLGAALEDDTALLQAVKSQAKTLMASSSYDWLIRPKTSSRQVRSFVAMREQLSEFTPPEVGRLLAYAATPRSLSNELWAVVEDSAGDEVCGRGPMTLTYRQAQNLGLSPKLDALISGDPADYRDDGSKEKRQAKLEATDDAAVRSDRGQLESFETTLDPLGGRNYCLSIDGEDKRTNTFSVAAALGRGLGEGAALVPDFEENPTVGLTARIAKLYVADFNNVDFSARRPELDLSRAPVGVTLKEAGSRGAWALDQTALVIAKAVVLPCRALLEATSSEKREALQDIYGDTLPDALSCLVLNYKLTNES